MSQACGIGLFTERIHFLTEITKLARPPTCQLFSRNWQWRPVTSSFCHTQSIHFHHVKNSPPLFGICKIYADFDTTVSERA